MPHFLLALAIFACMSTDMALANGPINILQYGAAGDCKTDDSTTINQAIKTIVNSKTAIGEIYFPTPPGGCYLVSNPIRLVDPQKKVQITLRGDGPQLSVIRASNLLVNPFSPAKMTPDRKNFTSDIESSVLYVNIGQWNYHSQIINIAFDANNVANYAVYLNSFSMGFINNIGGFNARNVNFFEGPETGNNVVSSSRFENGGPGGGGNVAPSAYYNMAIMSTDNVIQSNNLINAAYANIFDSGGANHFTDNHGWNWFYVPNQSNTAGDPTNNQQPTYNYIVGGASMWANNQADGSQDAGYYITGWGSKIIGGHAQLARRHGYCLDPNAHNVSIVGTDTMFVNDDNQNMWGPNYPANGSQGTYASMHQSAIALGNSSTDTRAPLASTSMGPSDGAGLCGDDATPIYQEGILVNGNASLGNTPVSSGTNISYPSVSGLNGTYGTTIGSTLPDQATLWSTSYVGMDASQSPAGNDWTILGDGAHNGGSAILNNVNGNMYFANLPSTGSKNQNLTDQQLFGQVTMSLTSQNQVGIGTTSPQTTLDVNGAVRVGNTNVTCWTNTAGAIRWTGSALEACDGKKWQVLMQQS